MARLPGYSSVKGSGHWPGVTKYADNIQWHLLMLLLSDTCIELCYSVAGVAFIPEVNICCFGNIMGQCVSCFV